MEPTIFSIEEAGRISSCCILFLKTSKKGSILTEDNQYRPGTGKKNYELQLMLKID